MFKFIRNSQTVFQSDCIIVYSTNSVWEFWLLAPSAALDTFQFVFVVVVLVLTCLAIAIDVKRYVTVVLICIPYRLIDIEHIFIDLLAICI